VTTLYLNYGGHGWNVIFLPLLKYHVKMLWWEMVEWWSVCKCVGVMVKICMGKVWSQLKNITLVLFRL
jgi:hypothetical protein